MFSKVPGWEKQRKKELPFQKAFKQCREVLRWAIFYLLLSWLQDRNSPLFKLEFPTRISITSHHPCVSACVLCHTRINPIVLFPLSTSEVGGFYKETQHLKNRIFETLTFSFLLTPSQQATVCFYDEVKSWPTSSAQMRKFRQPAMLPEVLLPLQQNIRRNSQNARQHREPSAGIGS